jgi:hypothetical protein
VEELHVKGRQQKIAERVLQSGARVVDERLGAEEPGTRQGHPGEGTRAAAHHDHGRESESIRHRQRREEKLTREGIGTAHRQHPQRVRVRLDAFAGIEHRAVSVEQVPDHPKGDVGVVSKPGIGEEHVRERRDQEGTANPRRMLKDERRVEIEAGGGLTGGNHGIVRGRRGSAPPAGRVTG